MDIAGLSMSLSQMKAAQQVSISVMKLSMDTAKNQGSEMVQMIQSNTGMLEQSVTPHLGASIDIRL
ncbi:conserved protein of unknown function [Acetoanaerobium sticklandii]|uniref:Motility protein n=1 Tax=Acetoanaerobium sticklandii (strain ATCC 12662 / DSM 519 / JCM 1433 / CCUG 9281 / NCIMB 10654 / HF) TaxID=499177 RepID=E3PUK7_ACESD|nr:YjfB family protein [Acetoanaerobium sticklandii]CBH22445.1 conserved protein of unknown function [Acetoanaerobium sticklandii]